MKPAKKYITIITGIIIFLTALGVYSAFRSDSLEKEYVSIITLKNSQLLKVLDNSIPEESKEKEKSKFETSLKKIRQTVPEIALIAVADTDYNVIVAGKNSKHVPHNETIDEILSDFTRKKLVPRNSFPLIIRYYDQSRFYIYVNKVNSYYVINAFPYMMTNRQIISFILEAALIAIVFIILTMSVYIILDRNKHGKIQPDLKKEEGDGITDVHGILEIFEECANLVDADTIIIETYNIMNNIFEISSEYSNGIISSPGPGRKNQKKLHDELVQELERQSMVLLDKNKTCVIPLTKNGELKGVVRIARRKPFNGNDMNLVEEYITLNIDDFLNDPKTI